MDMQKNSDPFDALSIACNENEFTYSVDGTAVAEINGVYSNDTFTWELWTIQKNSLTWEKVSSPQGIDLFNYTIAAWAYCDENGTPTVAVDESGRSIYGYQQAQRTITLSPALTEIIGSLRAVTTLVGTDRYSNHPDSVVAGHNEGKIKIIGDFLNPSFELIAGQRPDIVFCDGSLYSHHEITNRLRNASINAVLMYGGESVQEIMSNIYIAGVAMGYEIRAAEVLDILEQAAEGLTGALEESFLARNINVMLSLSPDKSPWVTGSGTFVDDLSSSVMGNNVFSSKYGWVHINSELVMTSNPSTIIILTADYSATQEEYDTMFRSLSTEWKATDAYKNGEIYLICDGAGVMSQCPSPRFAQLMEITARIMHPDVFTDIDMPKYVGDNYEDYLTFTKYLNFNE
ncbi:MAG: helical backbone metal receptor [Methanomassiliicoccaceae archaeon]|nr:helical backbone metal receptor [Methanomassiliicoccaceae archaeon]